MKLQAVKIAQTIGYIAHFGPLEHSFWGATEANLSAGWG